MPKDLLEKGEQGIAVYIMRIRDLKKLGTSPKSNPEKCRAGQCSPFIDTVWTFSVFLASAQPSFPEVTVGNDTFSFFAVGDVCMCPVSSIECDREREAHTHSPVEALRDLRCKER